MERSTRKPHNHLAGYVAERVCKHPVRGHVVLYDRERGYDCDADERWIVQHEPTGVHFAVRTKKQAYADMQAFASGNDQGTDFFEQVAAAQGDNMADDQSQAADKDLQTKLGMMQKRVNLLRQHHDNKFRQGMDADDALNASRLFAEAHAYLSEMRGLAFAMRLLTD